MIPMLKQTFSINNNISKICFTLLAMTFTVNVHAQLQDREYQKNNIHDESRPKPLRVIPVSGVFAPPPSDAIILFNGKNLNEWEGNFKIVDSTYMVAQEGGLKTKRKFGDVQLHVEWRVNDSLRPNGQKGANSGIFLMGKYEVQVLESFVNRTYADGQAGAVYGQYPPLVNASTPQGNWNSYDIIFTAPVYENGKLKKKAILTLIHNGVAVQVNQSYEGPTLHKKVTSYVNEHPELAPIFLQYHNDPIEYRNIWVRELRATEEAMESAWENPFPKGEMGKTYVVTNPPKTDSLYHFKVNQNTIEVLYDWVGTKAPFNMISTTKEYSYFNLELEYKWGARKFEPRLDAKRDAGILFHVHGENVVWPSSIECQVQEHDTGDLWVIKGPSVEVVEANGSLKRIDTKLKDYQTNRRYADYEVEGWNHVRVEVRGSESAKFYVNGHLVNEIRNIQMKDGAPLDKGTIGLQAEGAELTYRNIRVQEIK